MEHPQVSPPLSIVLVMLLLSSSVSVPEVFAGEMDMMAGQKTADTIRAQCSLLTKKILLAALELERFTLNYQLHAGKQAKLAHFRNFLFQETAAAGELTFETAALAQFEKGRFHPERIKPAALRNSTRGGMVAFIVAGSGSCLELVANTFVSLRNKQHGFDQKSADDYVRCKLNEIDEALARRDRLLQNHVADSAYSPAVAEGKVLQRLRDAMLDEYAGRHAYGRGKSVAVNSFYLMNAISAAWAATTAHVEIRAISNPRLKGPASIMFAIAGAGLMVPPLLSSAAGSLTRKRDCDSKYKRMHQMARSVALDVNSPDLPAGALACEDPAGRMLSATLEQLSDQAASSNNFSGQLRRATTDLGRFDKVGLQSSLAGPAIGGLFFTEGLIDTVSYYKYRSRPGKEITMFYHGTVSGTTAAVTQMFTDSALLLADRACWRRLRQQCRLPDQLVQKRLEYLDNLEKRIVALRVE